MWQVKQARIWQNKVGNDLDDAKWVCIFVFLHKLLTNNLELTDSEDAQRDPGDSQEIALQEWLNERRRTGRYSLKIAAHVCGWNLLSEMVEAVLSLLKEVNPQLTAYQEWGKLSVHCCRFISIWTVSWCYWPKWHRSIHTKCGWSMGSLATQPQQCASPSSASPKIVQSGMNEGTLVRCLAQELLQLCDIHCRFWCLPPCPGLNGCHLCHKWAAKEAHRRSLDEDSCWLEDKILCVGHLHRVSLRKIFDEQAMYVGHGTTAVMRRNLLNPVSNFL